MIAMWIIFRREFKARVMTKSFIIGTLVFPLMMLAMATLTMMAGGGSHRTLALIDAAPPGIADRFVGTLTEHSANTDQSLYTIEHVAGTYASNRETLDRRVLEKKIDGYVVLPADILEHNEVLYRARNITSMAVAKDLQTAANRAVQAQRLKESGVDAKQLQAIIKPVQLNSGQVTKDSSGKGSAMSSFMLAYGVAFLIYFTTITQGIGLLRSVLEEKTNRISEVMVSSVRPGYLMAGKIFGAGSAALLQVGMWIALLAVGLLTMRTRGLVSGEVISALRIDPVTIFVFFLFFLLGFFLYAAIFAAIGAMVNSEQEAQSVQSLALLPLVVPMLFLRAISDDPLGKLATWLGMIPFTSPISMPMRMASETLSFAQIGTSLGLLVVGLVAVTWIAGRIYRVGILSTGKKPSMRELVRWIKAH